MMVQDSQSQLSVLETSSQTQLPQVLSRRISLLVDRRVGADAEPVAAVSAATQFNELKVTSIHRRDLDLIQNQPIFSISLMIHVGAGRLSLRFEELGLAQPVVDVLKKAHASAPSIVIFPELQAHARTLQYRRKCLQERFMIRFEPFWVVHSRNLPEVHAEIKAMSEELDGLRQQVLDAYAAAYTRFLQTVAELASNAGLNSVGVAQALDAYADRFPTCEKVAQDFRLELFGPVAIPSLVEQVRENTELAAAVARQEEIDALRILQRSWQQQIQQSLGNAVRSARDEVCALIADSLSDIEGHQSGGLITPAARDRLHRTCERLQTLVNFDGSLGELVSEVSQVHSLFLATSTGRSATLAQKIQALRSQLRTELAQLHTAGDGHRALAEWVEL